MKTKKRSDTLTAEIYPDRGGKFRWRLRSSNGQKVAVSGESFASKSNAKRALKRLCAYVGTIWIHHS